MSLSSLRLLLSIAIALFATPALAFNDIGTSASIVTDMEVVIAKFMAVASFAVGLSYMLSAITKYKYHYDNPQAIPLSTPIFQTFFGLLLIGLGAFVLYFNEVRFELDGESHQQLIHKYQQQGLHVDKS